MQTRLQELARKRMRIFSKTPEKALEAILEDPQAAALVHSFPAEDLYFLVHDIGPDDALPLLALASENQWEYIIDVEAWQRDQVDCGALTEWLHRLLQANPRQMVHWCWTEQEAFFAYYLHQSIELRIREHDQDPSDFGDDFMTFDDVYYFRMREDSVAPELSPEQREIRETLIQDFLKRLADEDYGFFQRMLVHAGHILSAEAEEEAYRLRTVRLAEKGFLPFEEAVGVYQPLRPEGLGGRQVFKGGRDPARISTAAGSLMTAGNVFQQALEVIGSPEMADVLQIELAALCNRIAAADQKRIRSREDLRPVVEKACAYLSIALERLGPEAGDAEKASRKSRPLTQYALVDLFRIGYEAALSLKWRAEKWRRQSWCESGGIPLSFWDEQWMGVLGGLLLKKPLFFANYEGGVLYREFYSLAEIQASRKTLDRIAAVDDLLRCMDVVPKKPRNGLQTYKNFLLTLWSRNWAGLPETFAPVPLDVFRPFFTALWTGGPGPRQVRTAMKASFWAYLEARSGRSRKILQRQLVPVVEDLFSEIQAELGEVSVDGLDPRFVQLFRLVR